MSEYSSGVNFAQYFHDKWSETERLLRQSKEDLKAAKESIARLEEKLAAAQNDLDHEIRFADELSRRYEAAKTERQLWECSYPGCDSLSPQPGRCVHCLIYGAP